jgi:drug/metabolite transporter (DMT)-like permease
MLLRAINSLAQPLTSMRALGAYVAVALIVPGGSLIAFTVWAFRHRGWLTARTWRTLAGVAALGTGLMFPG